MIKIQGIYFINPPPVITYFDPIVDASTGRRGLREDNCLLGDAGNANVTSLGKAQGNIAS